MRTEKTELRIFQSATGRQRLQSRTVTSYIGDIVSGEYATKWKDIPVVYEGREQYEERAA